MIPKDDRYRWFPCDSSRLLGALSGMTPEEGYTYVVTLLRIYDVEGPCPDTPEQLARRTGLPVKKVRRALEHLTTAHAAGKQPKLRKTEAGFINDFAATILETRVKKKTRASIHGKTGAAARWGKDKENQRPPDRVGMPTLPLGDAELELEGEDRVRVRKIKSRPLAGTEGAPKKTKTAKPRGEPLPEDWKPDEDLVRYGLETVGLTREQVLAGAVEMKDWALANAHREIAYKAGERGWRAAFQRWLRQNKNDLQRTGSGARGPGTGRKSMAQIATERTPDDDRY